MENLACSLELSCPAQEKHVAQFEKQCATNAYAMTINKSQGQTLSHVGLHLTDHVFFAWPTFRCLFTRQGTNERQNLAARRYAWLDSPYAHCCI